MKNLICLFFCLVVSTLTGAEERAFVSVLRVIDGEDVYGRALAYVYLPGGRCLNEVLLRYGAALAPERYRSARQRDFAELERAAREQKRGFWKTLWKNF